MEEREENELAADMGCENMLRGKGVRVQVDLINGARAASREAEDETAGSGPKSETP